jgi:hypothetical protein
MLPVLDRNEAAEYYFTYIDKVPAGDIRQVLEAQLAEAVAWFDTISEEQSLHRYAAGKWSMRESLSHVNDTERVFVFRAFWFARGFESALPSFDQDVAVPHAAADARSWRSHIEEFQAVRAATLALFRSLPGEAWSRRGIASGNPVTVHALAHITAGHVEHHLRIFRERYSRG